MVVSTLYYKYSDTARRVPPPAALRLVFFFFDVKLFNSSSGCKKMCNDCKRQVWVVYYRNGEPKILKEIITYDKYDINKRYDLE